MTKEGGNTGSGAITGFFNGIPGDTSIVDARDAAGFNLVCTEWVYHKQFTLHQATEDLSPRLQAADESAIRCLGYISDAWTDFEVSIQSCGLVVFVVDTIFYVPGLPQTHNFLFNTTAFGSSRQRFSEGLLNQFEISDSQIQPVSPEHKRKRVDSTKVQPSHPG